MSVPAIRIHADSAESIDFRSPTQMAHVLLRRGHDLSFIRTAIRNEFGRAPSIDMLAAMKAKDEHHQAMQEKFSGGHASRTTCSQTVDFSETDKRRVMLRKGSEKLLKALREARG